VVDWHLRTTEQDRANPFRLLPRGYSVYSKADADEVDVKHDQVRDRRMTPDESARIDAALAGEKREDRERAWGPDPQFDMLYRLIVWQGLRLKEAYTARVEDFDFDANVLRVRGSKGHRGREKPRSMVIRLEIRDALQAYCRGRVGLLFDYWDGDLLTMRRAGQKLSARFKTLFDFAKVSDFLEHDLRHEATCRWVLLRDKAGRWAFSEIEICRMMGWSDPKMMMRYASLRGEDLSARLA
jgi:integrase